MLLARRLGISRTVEHHAVALSLGLTALVSLADLITPLGVASAVPYSLAILLGLKAKPRHFAVWLAALCSLLTVGDLFVGPGRGGSELWKVLTNRSMALCMIWLTLILGTLRRHAEERQREAETQTRLHLSDLAHLGRVETAGQMMLTLAHELNQPLAAISLQSEVANQLLREREAPDPRLLTALDEVTEQSHRAAEIIRSLRTLLRKGTPDRKPVQLNDVIHDVTRLLDAQFQRGRIAVQLILDPALPTVLGDRVQFEQVVLNLVQNAADAVAGVTGRGRQIVIETRADESGKVTVQVRDNGVGFGDQNAEQVFERFYSSKPTGLGMGLGISRSIIDAHQGRLWAQPNAGQGAVFCFSLPPAAEPQSAGKRADA